MPQTTLYTCPHVLAKLLSAVDSSKESLQQYNTGSTVQPPSPPLRGEAGLLNCEHKIMLEKVCLVSSIIFCHTEKENYARDILQEQLSQGWQGLAQEVVDICKKIGLPNACLEYVHRKKVCEAIILSHLQVLKKEYDMKKLKHLQHTDIRYRQSY